MDKHIININITSPLVNTIVVTGPMTDEQKSQLEKEVLDILLKVKKTVEITEYIPEIQE
jgi:hypothetical protein